MFNLKAKAIHLSFHIVQNIWKNYMTCSELCGPPFIKKTFAFFCMYLIFRYYCLLMVIICAIRQISCWMKKFVLQNRKIVKSRSYLIPLIFPHHQYSCIKNSLKLIVREIGLFQAFGLEKIHNAQILKLSFRNISQNSYYLAILL